MNELRFKLIYDRLDILEKTVKILTDAIEPRIKSAPGLISESDESENVPKRYYLQKICSMQYPFISEVPFVSNILENIFLVNSKILFDYADNKVLYSFKHNAKELLDKSTTDFGPNSSIYVYDHPYLFEISLEDQKSMYVCTVIANIFTQDGFECTKQEITTFPLSMCNEYKINLVRTNHLVIFYRTTSIICPTYFEDVKHRTYTYVPGPPVDIPNNIVRLDLDGMLKESSAFQTINGASLVSTTIDQACISPINKYTSPVLYQNRIAIILRNKHYVIYDFVLNKELSTIENKFESTSSPFQTVSVCVWFSHDKLFIAEKNDITVCRLSYTKKIAEENECVVCLEHMTRNYVLVPCGHTQYCDKCATETKTCQICHAEIVQVIKLVH